MVVMMVGALELHVRRFLSNTAASHRMVEIEQGWKCKSLKGVLSEILAFLAWN